ncbi:hypothetical protein [Sphingosinicella ginsenosidimutans]|uniref:hypothetical protein n=1 Tax=Allosphingosinicella ginsenosidimutans TaxID=1176539 RepID=UPI0011BF7BD4
MATTSLAVGAGVDPQWNLPCKRSIALLHARTHGFRIALLVDDDVWPISCADVELFARVENGILGRPPTSAADLSVIEAWCGLRDPHCFPNGNYLFFDGTAALGFFPKVYNDDWLFVTSSVAAQPATLPFGALRHGARPIDPLERVAQQEFGETLVKGLCDPGALPLDQAFWRRIYELRSRFLENLAQRQISLTRGRIVAEALRALSRFTPDDLLLWCDAFRRDLECWTQDGK